MHADCGSLARTPTKGTTSGSAGVPDNSLCEALPLEEELYFAVDDALVEHFLHHELLGLFRGILRVLLPPLLLPHGVHWKRGRGLAGHGQTPPRSSSSPCSNSGSEIKAKPCKQRAAADGAA